MILEVLARFYPHLLEAPPAAREAVASGSSSKIVLARVEEMMKVSLWDYLGISGQEDKHRYQTPVNNIALCV